MNKYLDLSGERFGRLTCLEDVGRDEKSKARLWRCKCQCGNEVVVRSINLRSGNSKSCGCLKSDLVSRRNFKHGLSTDELGRETRLYRIWQRMRQRCSDHNCTDFADYGGRGIKVCDDWENYKAFHDWAYGNGYQDHLSIDREDCNGNYEPGNCRWASSIDQARNTRRNHLITYRGRTKTLAEWSEILEIESSLLRWRLENWGIERSFSTPVRAIRRDAKGVVI